MDRLDRRTLLTRGAMAVVGFGLGGCSARSPRAAVPVRPALRLPPVKVAWERVIRTTVGLRPHRPHGFVLRADKLDHKTVIHNYGHGGAGMSLSWGTGQMAAELALEHQERRAAVIGCGIVGLTAARQLQRRGFDVTIYAATVPPDTTSNMSLAAFTPTSGLYVNSLRTAEWDEQFRKAVVLAYRQHQLMVGPKYGVSWIYNYAPVDDPNMSRGGNPLLPDEARTGVVVYGPGEHPFSFPYVIERPELRFEPSIYLDALMQDVIAFGGRIKIRRFETPRDLMALEEPVIVNCSGLGARALFGDTDLIPLKGQLVALIPQPEINYATSGGVRGSPPGVFVHMMPRSDGVILGGTSERDVWSLDVNEAERKRVVDGHIRMFSEFQPPGGMRSS